MKVYIVNTGTLDSDINALYHNVNLGTKSNPDPGVKWVSAPTYCVLIEHPQAGWILYDIGSHPESASIWPGMLSEVSNYKKVPGATIPEQLALLGLKPSDIKHIIISHMHMDHIGNIGLFKDTAKFYVPREEAKYAFMMVMGSLDKSKRGFYYREDVLTEVDLNYLDEDEELFPGVHTLMLPGHSPCVCGLLLELEDRNIILTSDAVNGAMIYNDGVLPGACYDTIGHQHTMRKLKKLEKEYDAMVFFSHDMEQFDTLKKIPEYYK